MTASGDAAAAPPPSIARLPELVEALPVDQHDLFRSLYHVTRSIGHLVVPDSSRSWIEHVFSSVGAVESQTIVRITNAVTLESAIFNPLRASRPMEFLSGELRKIIDDSQGDAFCRPEELTPEDVFGRIRGTHSITASNIAKFAPFHGLIIFDEHDPLSLSEESIRDYLEVGRRWAAEAMRLDPEARYYLFAWNALWSSGASVIHGHAQISCSQGAHYAKVEHQRRSALTYRRDAGRDYFEDLWHVHEVLGLGFQWGELRVIAHLTPIRDKEVVLMVPAGREATENVLAGGIYRALDCLIDMLGTRSFNVAIWSPPLGPSTEDWSGFPVMVRLVDRGDPMKRTNDVGYMEVYAAPVIPTDPFRLVEALRERFRST